MPSGRPRARSARASGATMRLARKLTEDLARYGCEATIRSKLASVRPARGINESSRNPWSPRGRTMGTGRSETGLPGAGADVGPPVFLQKRSKFGDLGFEFAGRGPAQRHFAPDHAGCRGR